jgi:hypothetical protein
MTINTSNYEFTHGRKPRGKGYWAFRFQKDMADGTADESVVFAPGDMKYAEAKRWAIQVAKANGVSRVAVAT